MSNSILRIILLLQDIQETMLLLLKKLEENVRELKEDVGFIKNRIDVNPKCDANATVENPFEILRSFGFRADSLEEVSESQHVVLYKLYT